MYHLKQRWKHSQNKPFSFTTLPGDISGCLQDCRTLTQKAAQCDLEPPEAEAASAWIVFIKKKKQKTKLFYLHFVCMRGRVWRHHGRGSFLQYLFQNEELASTVWHIRGVGWTLLCTCPARPLQHSEGKQQSRTQPSLCLMEKKQFTYIGKFAPTELLPAWNIY